MDVGQKRVDDESGIASLAGDDTLGELPHLPLAEGQNSGRRTPRVDAKPSASLAEPDEMAQIRRTSINAILALGWRHIANAFATSAVIFIIVTGGLMLMSG